MIDDFRLRIDERNGAMLHLACGIAFRVDVGDFLDLQRAFKRNRVRTVAPLRLASRRAASVSAVSPDWLMASTTVFCRKFSLR